MAEVPQVQDVRGEDRGLCVHHLQVLKLADQTYSFALSTNDDVFSFFQFTGVGTASVTFAHPQCLGITIIARPAIEPGE